MAEAAATSHGRLVLRPTPTGEYGKASEAWLKWHTEAISNRWSVTSDTAIGAGDVPVFWRRSDALAAPARLRRRALVIDPLTVPAIGDVVGLWAESHLPDAVPASQSALAKLLDAHRNAKRVLLIGSGPNRELPEPRPDDVNLYLGGAILDETLCELFPPHALVAADGASQFERTILSRKFQSRAEALIAEGAVLVAPSFYRPVVMAHWSDDALRAAIWIPRVQALPPGHKLVDELAYEPTSNVLTALGLPLAASLADTIVLIGISLSDSRETGRIWEHRDEAAYQRDLVDIVAVTPGSIARGDYRARHFARLRAEMAAHSRQGVRFAVVDEPVDVPEHAPVSRPRGQRLFAFLDWLDHRPEIVWGVAIVAVVSAVALSGRLLMGMVTLTLGAMAIALFAGLLALALYLRVRMARMAAETEARLAAQQAQQFRNLSTRLEALEQTLSGQSHRPD